jgi:hypothetical protein
VWCGECYTPHPLDKFFQYTPSDEGGFDWRPQDDLLRHRQARDGDMLLTPFQCDLCVFQNLQHRNPSPHNPKDDLLLCCIRRANLDAVWGREPQTVQATLRAAKQMILMWQQVGLVPSFPALGPFPVSDSFGMNIAIAMLLKSLEPGRYHDSYQQFETIRKLRAGFSNIYGVSLEGTSCLRTVGGDHIKHSLAHSPTQSLWFERFSQGCLRRMGQDVRQDWAITLPTMGALLDRLEREWVATNEQDLCQRDIVASIGAFSLIAFCGSFRGNEVFLTDLHGLRKYYKELEKKDYVIIPLLGRFKGEIHSRYHLTPLAAMTNSGLHVRVWVGRLIDVKQRLGLLQGPAFADRSGKVLASRLIESEIMERLQTIKLHQPGIIPGDVDCFEDFGISRSFRRGATSCARTRGVDDKQVDLINRWRKFEGARGRRPALAMHDHYSDIEIMIPEMVKFSKAL